MENIKDWRLDRSLVSQDLDTLKKDIKIFYIDSNVIWADRYFNSTKNWIIVDWKWLYEFLWNQKNHTARLTISVNEAWKLSFCKTFEVTRWVNQNEIILEWKLYNLWDEYLKNYLKFYKN